MNNWSAVSNIGDILALANTNSGGLFWLGMLFTIFIVMTVALTGFGWEIAILSSAFVGLVVGLFLTYMNLVAWQYLLIFPGIIIIMFIYITYSTSRDTY